MEQQRLIRKKYSNEDITVVWQPHICIHSAICFRGLHQVFNPQKRPWVNIEGADSETIMKQIDECPSGALSYYRNEEKDTSKNTTESETIIEVAQNVPLIGFWKYHNQRFGRKSDKEE